MARRLTSLARASLSSDLPFPFVADTPLFLSVHSSRSNAAIMATEKIPYGSINGIFGWNETTILLLWSDTTQSTKTLPYATS